jgi:pseudouridine-5'-phosphate glycosidase
MIEVHPQVARALREGRPVVALESAVVTCGLPETPSDADGGAPLNLAAAQRMVRAVRESGAVPATIGVLGGRLQVGMDDADLETLAREARGAKAAARDLGRVLSAGSNAGTTVSATLAACRAVEGGPIRVMATGGIGGVHRAWTILPDVSSDLAELARSPVCVVCSGPKSVLDVPATYEALEALGIAVWTYRTDARPALSNRPVEALGAAVRLESPAEVAAACRGQWAVLGPDRGVLLANPPPPDVALDPDEVDAIVTAAERDSDRSGGGDRTPHLLAALDRGTGGRALVANVALLEANARLAGAVAAALTEP